MAKRSFKPGNMVYPVPAALISCGSGESANVFTASWVGTLCTNPPMAYVSIRPERHSHGIITRTGEFVINLSTESIARATDWCGVKSGRDGDKFAAAGLTPAKASVINSVIVEESPLSIECKVREVMHLGSHDMFIADVVAVLADERYFDLETDRFDLASSGLISYIHGGYYSTGKQIGTFGWSVKKKKK